MATSFDPVFGIVTMQSMPAADGVNTPTIGTRKATWLLMLLIALYTATTQADIHDTKLGSIADSLEAGEYAELPAPTLTALPMSKLGYSQLYWNDSAVWDGRRISQINGPGTCCASPAQFRRLVYDTVSDVWSITDTQWAGSGHAYDGNAYDPTSGTYYFVQPQARIHASSDGVTWTTLPPVPFTSQVVSASITWFPDANGGSGALIYVGGYSQLAAYYGGAWHVIAGAAAAPWGPYNASSEYNPVHRRVWLGGNTRSYKLDANLTLTLLSEAPVSMNNNAAYHATDPISGKHIITRISDRTWWEFDLAADTWTQRTDWTKAPVLAAAYSGFQVAVPELGVILYVSQYYNLRKAWIVKVSAPPLIASSCIPLDYDVQPPLRFCARPAASICEVPGMLACDVFDTELPGRITAGDSRAQVVDGTLKFTLPSSGGANSGGEYRVTFPAVGQGRLLAFSYRIKADAAAVALPGRKEFVMWRGSSSCTNLELAQTHWYASALIMPYTECGSHPTYTSLGGGDFLFHGGDFDCKYQQAKVGNFANCALTRPGQWERYYAELEIGTYGQPNSRLTMWYSDGETWRIYIARNDFTFNGSGGFDHFMLTPYMTALVPSVHPPGTVLYDDFVIATQPFLELLPQ